MNRSKRSIAVVIATVAITAFLGVLSVIMSTVPQTIVVDGTNDFLPGNLVDNDTGDTQFSQIDLGNIYVTNDANKLYVGFDYNKGTWTTNQLGIMLATGGPSGGTTDAWGHAIAWTTAPRKPDYQAYCNMDNSWQELRHWDGASWALIYSGTNSLGWVNNTGFEEVGFNLTDLGLSHGDTVYIELISTQNGGTKGPLDCMVNDGKQLSHLSSTTWDVATPVQLDSMKMYIVVASSDIVPPTVTHATGSADMVGLGPMNKIDVLYSEPVDKTTAENKNNYALTGTAATIDSVRRDPVILSKVKIYLHSSIAQQASFYKVTVTNVKDLANNTIVANGTTNVGCFYIQKVVFRGGMYYHLLQHSVPPVDTFTVVGDLAPLDFIPCDNAFMTSTGGGWYEVSALYSLIGKGCGGTPSADTTLQWKFMHQCTEYEPLATNRHSVLSSANGPIDTLEYWWNDQGPDQFLAGPVDLILTLDVARFSPGPDSVVAVNGSVAPLKFNVPSETNMKDDGVSPDAVAGDKVYSVKVRFPINSFKTVGYKFLYNDRYECLLEGNREVWLNDAAFDTVGGAKGPLVMPLAYYDRCGTIGRDVKVIFRVATLGVLPSDTIAVNGGPNNQLPEVINWNIPSINRMHDDGVDPDVKAGDGIYTKAVTFPDSSSRYVEYKYLKNSAYECALQSNRYFYIDDAYDATGNPEILELDYFNSCEATDVPRITPVIPLALHQNYPNPFNPTTTITFTAPAQGRALLRIYDVQGKLVKTVFDDVVQPGTVTVRWDGTDADGRKVSTGVYFYEVRIGGERATRKMVLLK
jgi:hypothetical protein